MALGTDLSLCGKTTGKTGFLCCRRVVASYSGESPLSRESLYCYHYTLPAGDGDGGVSRALRAARASLHQCVHNRAHTVDNRPPMIRAEANPDTVNVGALMTVQVPEGLGPGSVFTVDVPGRGACRVTVPPGVFAGQTFTLLHPDYVSN